jgi:putative transcriptional regulator
MNKPLRIKLSEVVDTFNDFDAKVYLGGPVAENKLFFIHTFGDLIPESYKIMDGLYWGGDTEVLNTLIEQGVADEKHVRFFLGYSGWEAGQLRSELERNSWAVSQANSHLLLGTPGKELWKTLIGRLGKEYGMWSRFPKNPEEN